MSKFESLIGACQWMISLCQLDVAHAIISLSHFRHCPRQGHIDQLKQLGGYIHTFPQGTLQFQIGLPDHESLFGSFPPA